MISDQWWTNVLTDVCIETMGVLCLHVQGSEGV